MSDMKYTIEYITKCLVHDPDAVRVRELQGVSATIIELSVAQDDMGRVIGKGGRVVNALRTLLGVIAAKQGKRVTLEIV